MLNRIFIFTMVIACTRFAQAGSIDINVHSEAFRVTYATHTGKKTVADVGVLLLERKHNDDEPLFHAGVHAVFDNLRFGVRAIYATPGAADVLALGFGLQGRFALSRQVGFGGHLYYAPSVTSALDSEGYNELAFKLDFKLAQGAYCYVGYRTVKVRIYSEKNKTELDDDFHLGVKLFF